MLAFRFVATLRERRADPVERIGTPEQLRAWLIANELGSADMPASESLLRDARALREAIHRAGTAMAAGGYRIRSMRNCSTAGPRVTGRGSSSPVGRPSGISRRRTPRAPRAVVALDAVATLGGHGEGVIKRCEQRTCGGLFVDTSRGRRRRWCSTATCGNKVKKANLKAARDGTEPGLTGG
ncbi:CGNR zinc finger domain-containing protein [Streptomyces sp. Je 1-4 4N24_ara]|uniref:CGNR zinc finger domain-containing protein n=1 Tax=Streptomyces TaxID=1883 RepID=UPI0034DEAD28